MRAIGIINTTFEADVPYNGTMINVDITYNATAYGDVTDYESDHGTFYFKAEPTGDFELDTYEYKVDGELTDDLDGTLAEWCEKNLEDYVDVNLAEWVDIE